MKFAETLAMAAMATLSMAADCPIDGGARMHLNSFASETGPLVDAIHNNKFTVEKENQNFLMIDTISLLMGESQTWDQKMLKSKVKQFKKNQLRKQNKQMSQKFGGKKRRLGINDDVRVQNYRNQMYYGAIYVGESDMEMQVIIDTSSDWLAIEGQDCLSCNENRYDSNTSGFFGVVGEEVFERTYGSFIDL